MKSGCDFSYDPVERVFFFADQEDYEWAKAVLGNLSLKLYINRHPMEPFQLFCSNKERLLILKGLSPNDGQELVELFELNGLKRKALDENVDFKSRSTILANPKGGAQITPRFSSLIDEKDGRSSDYTEGLEAARRKLLK